MLKFFEVRHGRVSQIGIAVYMMAVDNNISRSILTDRWVTLKLI